VKKAHAHSPAVVGDSFAFETSKLVKAELIVDGVKNGQMSPRQESNWEIIIKDKDGKPIENFEPVHGRADETDLLHISATRDDFDTYAHFHPHPCFEKGKGHFCSTANKVIQCQQLAGCDIDNLHLKDAVPEAGEYYLFSEIKPKGMDVQYIRYKVTASGREEA